jgi:acetolactate synthase-1/2/3 large subunit
MPTNAQVIASTLARAGTEFAFGLPGGEVTALIQACRSAGIRFMLTGHEASAAFMADVSGQITGRAGVCIATLGPGAMNLVLGVANALLDRSPVLALTAQVPEAIADHYSHQRIPLARVFGAICKASAVVDGRSTGELVEASLGLASSPPWGPVHLALPSDAADHEVAPGTPPALLREQPEDHASASLTDAAAMLRDARRPLLVVGIGWRPYDIPALWGFVERTGMPFVVTPKAKGLLPENAPGFLGVIGGMALDRAVMQAVDQADLLLGVGFDPVECDRPWYASHRIVNLSRYPTREGRYVPVEHVGDIGRALQVLADIPCAPWPEDLLAECGRRLQPPPIHSDHAVSPLEALHAMQDVLPIETILTSDVGSHKYYAAQFWQSLRPQAFFVSNGLSAMGYGLPAAIAAKLHYPTAPVVALVGDGGMQMMLHNLTFMRQYQVPVVTVCFVDESLSLIRISQQRRGVEPYGVDFPAPDFAAAAAAFGVPGTRVDSADALKGALEDAVRSGQAAVISVPVNLHEYEAYV